VPRHPLRAALRLAAVRPPVVLAGLLLAAGLFGSGCSVERPVEEETFPAYVQKPINTTRPSALSAAIEVSYPLIHPAIPPTSGAIVELGGRYLLPSEARPDVRFEADWRSMVHVDEPRMYAVVALPAVGEATLTLRSNSDGFAMYAVTFGKYEAGP
jgi:hypothetical protein